MDMVIDNNNLLIYENALNCV